MRLWFKFFGFLVHMRTPRSWTLQRKPHFLPGDPDWNCNSQAPTLYILCSHNRKSFPGQGAVTLNIYKGVHLRALKRSNTFNTHNNKIGFFRHPTAQRARMRAQAQNMTCHNRRAASNRIFNLKTVRLPAPRDELSEPTRAAHLPAPGFYCVSERERENARGGRAVQN